MPLLSSSCVLLCLFPLVFVVDAAGNVFFAHETNTQMKQKRNECGSVRVCSFSLSNLIVLFLLLLLFFATAAVVRQPRKTNCINMMVDGRGGVCCWCQSVVKKEVDYDTHESIDSLCSVNESDRFASSHIFLIVAFSSNDVY